MNWLFKITIKSAITLGIILSIAFYVKHIVGDYDELMSNVKMARLNRLLPSFSSIVSAIEDDENLDEEVLKHNLIYYKKVIEYMPLMADAYGMLGFSYHQLEEPQKAKDAYKKAVELNPNFFWYPYNLGLMAFQEKQYSKAADHFSTALKIPPERTLYMIKTSRIYQQIIHGSREFRYPLNNKLKEGYQNSYILLIESFYNLKKYPEMYQVAKMAKEFVPEQKAILNYYQGVASYNMKDYKQAAYIFQEIIKADEKFAESFEYFGLSMKELNNDVVAVMALTKAKELKKANNFTPLPDMKALNIQVF